VWGPELGYELYATIKGIYGCTFRAEEIVADVLASNVWNPLKILLSSWSGKM
jgi:hypothetical protein